MLRAGLVDGISLLIAPAADGTVGAPSLFDVDSKEGMLTASPSSPPFELHSVERRDGDVLWLRYRVSGGKGKH
jgi:riboflavin biosynthesis pyrimidine reductase